ncbi:putative 2'-5' RNA ligase [Variovorax paradoxus B4]|uniref:Putative 2'-5' RNA ligase n=1 Tax=Variovorax paradoxus B4 TaxID=1246301 RepID=T1XBD2_VARPD|nr:RNA 2',3'-cyclic phosphodiesterase [Variovorax paradoxus]AGU49863.1 putative 2'-5' RNA ligase [Variovorax paradoxus B4]
MPEQLLLPGIDPAPLPVRRPRGTVPRRERLPRSLFFAIFPRPEDAASIAALGARLKDRHALKGKLTEAHRLHVTLHHLGSYPAVPRETVQAALEAAAAVAPPSFEVVFDEAMRFEQSKAFVLCGGDSDTAALAAFRQRLGEALADAGFKPERGFTPHMTLAYTPRKIERHSIEPVRWTARSFSLIESHVGESIHEVLGQWPSAPAA